MNIMFKGISPTMRRQTMQAYGEGTFTYTYDAANRQTKITNTQNKTTTQVYDAVGQLTQRQFSNGAVTDQSFDRAGNVSQIVNRSSSGLVVSRLDYRYDGTNRRMVQMESDEEAESTSSSSGSSDSSLSSGSSSSSGPRRRMLTGWGYDRTYQVTNEYRRVGTLSWSDLTVDEWSVLSVDDWANLPVDSEEPSIVAVTYTYDPAGNRTVMNDGGVLTTYTYSNANRLETANTEGAVTTYIHDEAGNRTEEQSPTGNTYYTWDAAGQMVNAEPAAGVTTFAYNADGQRVIKESHDGSTIGFLYDHRNLLEETDDVGGDVAKLYTTATDEEFGDLISEYDEENGDLTHQYDGQASTNTLLDEAGDPVSPEPYAYRAFGQLEPNPVNPAAPPSKMSWGGKKQYYKDDEIDLYLLGSGTNGRYYDPKAGRFTSEDPIRYAAGDANLYRPMGNDPVNHTDSSGTETDDDITTDYLKELDAATKEDPNAVFKPWDKYFFLWITLRTMFFDAPVMTGRGIRKAFGEAKQDISKQLEQTPSDQTSQRFALRAAQAFVYGSEPITYGAFLYSEGVSLGPLGRLKWVKPFAPYLVGLGAIERTLYVATTPWDQLQIEDFMDVGAAYWGAWYVASSRFRAPKVTGEPAIDELLWRLKTEKYLSLGTTGGGSNPFEVIPRPGMTMVEMKAPNGKLVKVWGQAEGSSSTTSGHAEAIWAKVMEMVNSGLYRDIVMQRSWRTATGYQSLSRKIPDVIGVRWTNKVDAVEVQSITDDPMDLRNRLTEGRLTVPKQFRGGIRVILPQSPPPKVD